MIWVALGLLCVMLGALFWRVIQIETRTDRADASPPQVQPQYRTERTREARASKRVDDRLNDALGDLLRASASPVGEVTVRIAMTRSEAAAASLELAALGHKPALKPIRDALKLACEAKR